jgi:hypothetical protein
MEINLNLLGLNTIGFSNFNLYYLGLIFLIILIIIYLVKPKSIERVIPSLMFLVLNKKKGKFNSFFKKLLIDPLLILQFIIIFFISLAILMPHVTYEYDLSDENTIFVIDVSASMHAENRIQEIKEIVKKEAKGSISAVLIKQNPHLYFEDETPKKAIELIDLLKPTVSTTNILDAIKIADEKMQNKTGRIIVISDFKETKNSYNDLINLKSFLEAKSRIIEYHILEPKQNNIGFINYEFRNNELTLYVKNYNLKKEEVTILYNNQRKNILIEPKSIELIRLNLDKGLKTIKIENKDEFMLDNEFYINVPDDRKMKVLLITNNKNTYLHDFLRSSPYIDLQILEPPLIPTTNFDVIVFDNVKKELMLSRIKDELITYVSEGGSLVLTRTENIEDYSFEEILPVELSYEVIRNMQTNSYEELTKDLVFGTINQFKNAKLKQGSVALLDGNLATLIAYSKYNKGNVLYYAIPEDNNDFKFTTSFPLFWNRALRLISQFNEFENLNKKSEDFGFEERLGFIEQGTKTIAVNLINEKESEVTAETGIINFIESSKFEKQSLFIKKNYDLNLILIPLIFLILFIELLFIKYRGDI